MWVDLTIQVILTGPWDRINFTCDMFFPKGQSSWFEFLGPLSVFSYCVSLYPAVIMIALSFFPFSSDSFHSILHVYPCFSQFHDSLPHNICMVPPLDHPCTDMICLSSLTEMGILNPGEKSETPAPTKNEALPPDFGFSVVSAAGPKHLSPTSEPLEAPLSKGPRESPAKKHPKNRVRLAANFSFAPITKL